MMRNIFKKKDIIIIGAAAILIAVSLIVTAVLGMRPAETAEVSVNGYVTAVYPLNLNGEYTVTGHDGNNVVFSISNGSVDVIFADCPNQICVHHVPVTRSGESIVCLPNRVVITLRSRGGDAVDAVAR